MVKLNRISMSKYVLAVCKMPLCYIFNDTCIINGSRGDVCGTENINEKGF